MACPGPPPRRPGFAASAATPDVRAGFAPVPLLAVPLRLVGVIGRLYVVLESDRGLVLLDQHAAHERILFERMMTELERGDAPSQRLLLAETVELSARDADFVRQLLPTLSRLGVGLSEFGERTFLLDALPPYVRVGDARQFVIELVDRLKGSRAGGQRLAVGRGRGGQDRLPACRQGERSIGGTGAASSSRTCAIARCLTPARMAAPP